MAWLRTGLTPLPRACGMLLLSACPPAGLGVSREEEGPEQGWPEAQRSAAPSPSICSRHSAASPLPPAQVEAAAGAAGWQGGAAPGIGEQALAPAHAPLPQMGWAAVVAAPAALPAAPPVEPPAPAPWPTIAGAPPAAAAAAVPLVHASGATVWAQQGASLAHRLAHSPSPAPSSTGAWPPVASAGPAAAAGSRPLPAAGLSNEAGDYNCFLNVIIQCLWHCTEFRAAVLAWPPEFHLADPVVAALHQLLQAVQAAGHGTSQRGVVNPNRLREALSALPGQNFKARGAKWAWVCGWGGWVGASALVCGAQP